MNTAIPLRRKRDLACQPYSSQDGDILMENLLEAGYIAHPSDVAWAWYRHSDSMCATWLVVYNEPQANTEVLLRYLEPTI